MSYQNAISREDPQAIEKLQAKLEECEKMQVKMKSVNAYYRKHGTCVGHPDLTKEQAYKLEESMSHHSWDYQPYASYALTNNNAEIRRLKLRIKELTQDKELGFTGWKFEGGKAIANDELCRLQLMFDEKPAEEQICKLKLNGFKWSPNNQAWQRQLNQNAIYAADRLGFVNPVDGKRAYELQPKMEAKEKSGEVR